MNLAAVFHRPMSEYAFAMDENTYVFRLRAQRGDLKRCTLHYADRAAMTPELDFQRAEMPLWRSDSLFDWFEITLTCPFCRIAYHFELDDGSETCRYAGDCFEKDPAMIQRSEHFQLPYNHRGFGLFPMNVAKAPPWKHGNQSVPVSVPASETRT